MKKLLIFAIIFFVGCAQFIGSKNSKNLSLLKVGMDKSEALQIMGTRTNYVFTNLLRVEPLNSPIRVEMIQDKDGQTYEVLLYYTGLGKALREDTQLTPILCKNGKVVGWGWSFMKMLK